MSQMRIPRHTNTAERHQKIKSNDDFFLALLADGIFRVDDFGRVWRASGGILRLADKGRGGIYLVVSYCDDYPRRTIPAHRLVWMARNGPIPLGMQINHINNRPHDNRPENLEVVTHGGNVRHGMRFRVSRQQIVEGAREKLRELEESMGIAL